MQRQPSSGTALVQGQQDSKPAKLSSYDGGRATSWTRKQIRELREDNITAHRLKIDSMVSFLPTRLIQIIHNELFQADGKTPVTQIVPRPSKSDFSGVIVMADLVKSTMLSEEMEVMAGREHCGEKFDEKEEEEEAAEAEAANERLQQASRAAKAAEAKGRAQAKGGPGSGSNNVDAVAAAAGDDEKEEEEEESENGDKNKPLTYDANKKGKRRSLWEGENSQSTHSREYMVLKNAQSLRDRQNDASKLGAERLRTVLTKYFRLLVGVTMSHGGDVVRIAGDAIISVFEDDKKTLLENVTAAQNACLNMLRLYNNYEVDGKNLQIRVYMVIGSLSIFCVGGYQGRWEYMLSGQPFADLKVMGNLADPGELAMSQPCWDIMYGQSSNDVPTETTYLDLKSFGEKVGIKRVKTEGTKPKTCIVLHCPKAKKPVKANNNNDSDSGGEESLVLTQRSYHKTVRQKLVSDAKTYKAFEVRLKHFVPVPVTYHCDHQNLDLEWLEEAVQCAAMFITFKDEIDDLQGVQRLFIGLQHILVDNAGIIKEFSMDDKGLVIVCGFGLQPNIMTNPSASACLAALQILHSKSINEHGSICIGLATGEVFCAAVGSSYRREFALVGKVVNLAARLAFFAREMSRLKGANPTHRICVDLVTKSLAAPKIDFELFASEKAVNLKGIKGTTQIFCPVEPRYEQLLEIANLLHTDLIGRTEEQDVIKTKLEELCLDLPGGLVLIKGVPGVGKSKIVQHLVRPNPRLSQLIVFQGNASLNMNLQQTRVSLAARSFQYCQAEGFNAWPQIIIKALVVFRGGIIEQSMGKVLPAADLALVKQAFTTFVPGRVEGVDDGPDSIKARTVFVKLVHSRFLQDGNDTFFLLNSMLGLDCDCPPEYRSFTNEQVVTEVFNLVGRIFKRITEFAPISLIIDDAQVCDKESIGLLGHLVKLLHGVALFFVCCRTGDRDLPDLRLHVPMSSIQTVKLNENKKLQTLLVMNKLFGGSNGGTNSNLAVVGEGDEIAEALKAKLTMKDSAVPTTSSSSKEPLKPVPPTKPQTKIAPKLSKGKNAQPVASQRATIMAKRIDEKAAAMLEAENPVFVMNEADVVVKRDDESDACIFDYLVAHLSSEGIESTVLLVKPFNFNETIALTAARLKADKVCNITAAVMYGHTQGNAKYICDFADYLLEPPYDGGKKQMVYGEAVRAFQEDLSLSSVTTWTLKELRVPETFFQYTPPAMMDAVRAILKMCTAQQVLLLKVIAVVGGSDCPIFLLETLLEEAVLSVSQLPDDLSSLVAMGAIETTTVKSMTSSDRFTDNTQSDQKQEGEFYVTYTFKNVHCQTALYNMLSFSRRQELHAAVAKWYEEKLGVRDEDASDTETNDAKYIPSPLFKIMAKRSVCFVIHHAFMSSQVEKSVEICKFVGVMELSTFCGQYARKVLLHLPADISEAVVNRIFPVIRWMQGVNSVANSIKKGKIGFASVTAGKMLTSKLQKTNSQRKNDLDMLGESSSRISSIGPLKKPFSKLGSSSDMLPALPGGGGGDGGKEKIHRESVKFQKITSAYGNKSEKANVIAAASSEIKQEEEQVKVLTTSAAFENIGWQDNLKNSAKRFTLAWAKAKTTVMNGGKEVANPMTASTRFAVDAVQKSNESDDLDADALSFGPGSMLDNKSRRETFGSENSFWKPKFDVTAAIRKGGDIDTEKTTATSIVSNSTDEDKNTGTTEIALLLLNTFANKEKKNGEPASPDQLAR